MISRRLRSLVCCAALFLSSAPIALLAETSTVRLKLVLVTPNGDLLKYRVDRLADGEGRTVSYSFNDGVLGVPFGKDLSIFVTPYDKNGPWARTPIRTRVDWLSSFQVRVLRKDESDRIGFPPAIRGRLIDSGQPRRFTWLTVRSSFGSLRPLPEDDLVVEVGSDGRFELPGWLPGGLYTVTVCRPEKPPQAHIVKLDDGEVRSVSIQVRE